MVMRRMKIWRKTNKKLEMGQWRRKPIEFLFEEKDKKLMETKKDNEVATQRDEREQPNFRMKL